MSFRSAKSVEPVHKPSQEKDAAGKDSYLASMIGWAIALPCLLALLIMLAR